MANQKKSRQKTANQNMTMQKDESLIKFYNELVAAAKSFGFNEKNGKLRECILNKDATGIRAAKEDDDNFWFGFVRDDQPDNDAYQGLSFVIFPESVKKEEKTNNSAKEGDSNVTKESDFKVVNEKGNEDDKKGEEVEPQNNKSNGHNCVAAICIGSSNLGADSGLASSPLFRRSFNSLRGIYDKKENKVILQEDVKFFFKYRFDEIDQPTPGLQDYIKNEKFDGAMQATTAKYNTGKKGGLLPAAMIVDYTSDEGYALIVSWLAQYALWRNWASTNEGKEKQPGNPLDNIKNAISKCRVEATCPTPEDVKKILFDRRFIVLQGAPGCGKTWTAKEIAKMSEFKEVKFIQFHAETTYADFVYGIKPVLNGFSVAYEGRKGVLLEILDSAIEAEKNQKDEKFLLIIDEFNRANLANVLGPVFYLFEQNSGDNNLELKLGRWLDPDEKDEKVKIKELVYKYIPDNLYVIATMNTADKSLAVVDFALRRRFSWVTLRPHKLDLTNFDRKLFDEVNALFMKYATDEELNLQPGQSYFMDENKRKDSIIYGLMPLMKEYFNGGYLLPARDEFIQLFYRETGIFMYE